VRRSRTTAIVAIAMFGAIALAGCAKDSGETASGDTAGQTGTGCKLAARPPAAPAASSSASGSGGSTVDASALRVGLAYDVGGRGDASFNDAAAAGLDKAKSDLGVKDTRETTAAAGESEDAKQSRLRPWSPVCP